MGHATWSLSEKFEEGNISILPIGINVIVYHLTEASLHHPKILIETNKLFNNLNQMYIQIYSSINNQGEREPLLSRF